jgi:hypothetical protein
MNRMLLAVAAIPIAAAFAGALTLEVGNADANQEATALNAVLVARVTACHEPGKSTVTANSVQLINGQLQRIPLKVVALKTAGTFAVMGPVAGAIDLAVTNPEYKNYEPRVLIHASSKGIEWASMKRFFGTPPTDADLRAALD